MKRLGIHILVLVLAVICIPAFGARSPDVSPDGLWVDVPVLQSVAATNVWVNPPVFRAMALDTEGMRAQLSTAPMEGSADVPIVLWLPMPDGTFQRFSMAESPVMPPSLQAQFSDIRTYAGQGVDDPAATIRLDLTPAGFHAQILSPAGAAYVDKHTRDAGVYAVYWKKDHRRITEDFHCMVTGRTTSVSLQSTAPSPQGLAIGGNLRTYRLACAATAEYTAFQGGTVSNGMAAIVTTVNRVTGIYETELGIRLVLVTNNNLIVYTNAGTDPYTNTDSNMLLTQNQSQLDLVIGDANYDIGHVFSTAGGGLASLGVVCDGGQKAKGETGTSSPVGDSFDVDYVAHEMGHQFGGDHTFNSESGSCSGNRNAATAYEVGSGSTIMAYAGICGSDNTQSHSDPFFHFVSYGEIVAYTRWNVGASCPVVTASTNVAPVVAALPSYVIPKSTPFVLTASASDANGDPLTYCWEERDLGPTTTLGAADNGSSPLFRSYAPVSSPSRSFPSVGNIMSNSASTAEVLPTKSRTLGFRVTVRDNRSVGGVNSADTTLTVATNAGPFTVNSFNSGGTFTGRVAVLWAVNGTTGMPVNCSSVSILLSTNGGFDFPFVLASAVPNNGSNNIVLPSLSTTKARVKVQAVGNIFFDVCNTNFTISAGGAAGNVVAATNVLTSESCAPTNGRLDAAETVTVDFSLRNSGSANTTNVQATLLTNSGITAISGPQSYGALTTNGASASRSFSFTVLAGCGSTVTGVLQLADGATSLGTAYFVMPVGGYVPVYTESFDNVTAPALPVGWTNAKSGSQLVWTTRMAGAESAPNAAFCQDVIAAGLSDLVSPSWSVATANARLTFVHNFDLELDDTGIYDGGVLEIKIGSGAFADVLSNGCSFSAGGYNPTGKVDSGYSNPLAGRSCWSGNSGGFITTVVNLPASAAGTNVQFRWRCGTDSGTGGAGWWIDGVVLSEVVCCTNVASADLALMMSGSPLSLIATQQVAFVLSVTNSGAAAASSVVISNPVPPLSVAISAVPSQGTCITNAGTIICNLGSIASGAVANATIVLAAQNPSVQIAVLTNSAVVSSFVNDPVATNNSAQAILIVYKDSVGDGVPDFWRQQHFGSATTTNTNSCATCDADGDGFDNRSEFLADTIPTNAASFLRIASLLTGSSTQQVSVASSTGRLYSVEFTSGIDTGLWQLSNGFLPGNGGTNNFPSTNAVSPGFFRVKAALP